MRIITGIAKGCKLKAPKGMITRPTADRVKESLFSIIQSKLYDAEVLDVFAGSGNLGLEALSRGAKSTFFVDQSQDSVRTIKENAQHTKLIDKCTIYKMDVLVALRKFMHLKFMFDILFCDPPYNKGFGEKVLFALDEVPILESDALVVIEHAKEDGLTEELNHLTVVKKQIYGSTAITIYRYNE